MPLTLADAIEDYLLRLLGEAERTILEISRRQLADRFRCAPSQINYVLETRFSPERGFVVRSRRGGGGCIFITPVTFDGTGELLRRVHRQAAQGLTVVQARNLVRLLHGEGVVTGREAMLMEAALGGPFLAGPGDSDRALRGRVMQAMLCGLMS